ncbi:FecR family protein [Sphingopyxis sp. KK2]|uniref:FecR family protein n=1 Tax=Sphingopyxis sp. KK2 TaxID=1855727 RepID=UPI00097E5903|nr:FecR domain-containing protein [Sphingopyxis sp. KK2]
MSERDREASAWFARMRGPDAADHAGAFDAWRRDPANAAAYSELEEDWLIAGGVSRAHVAAHATPRAAAPRSPMRFAMAAALVAAIALGFAWYAGIGQDKPIIAEPTGRDGNLQLPDGSTVRLADGAYAEIRFAANERRVLLVGGRAWFKVAHDAARPFIVEAEGSETIALGTEFEVDLRKGPVLVQLIKGSVEVRAVGTKSAVRLRPGERAAVENREARIVAPMTLPVAETIIDADNLSVATLLDRANRVNPVPIRLAAPETGRLQVTGRFDIADSMALARKLAAALDLDVEARIDEITLRPKVN